MTSPDMTPEEREDVDQVLSAFFRDLAAKQQPLGKEFEEVLYDDLWNLYARADKNEQGD